MRERDHWIKERTVYLDSNATTPLDEAVLAAMLPFLRGIHGNASSSHAAGLVAREAVEEARKSVASLLCARPREIVFTSGATEANNLALKGCASGSSPRRHLVSCVTEHPAVLEPLAALRRLGFDVTLIPVDGSGVIDLAALNGALSPATLLVSVMAANNETGTLAPIGEVGRLAHQVGAVFHCDATQLLPWGTLDVEELGIDLLSMSAHKLHGPQGVGALYVSRRLSVTLAPLLDGGGHERGLRSGTLNTAGIVGLGAAAAIAAAEGEAAAVRVDRLRDQLHTQLMTSLPSVTLNGHPTKRLPGTVNLCFEGADAEAVMASMPEVAVATGSACSSGTPGASHVLRAMGLTDECAASSLRFGLNRQTTAEDVDYAIHRTLEAVSEVRSRMDTMAQHAGGFSVGEARPGVSA